MKLPSTSLPRIWFLLSFPQAELWRFVKWKARSHLFGWRLPPQNLDSEFVCVCTIYKLTPTKVITLRIPGPPRAGLVKVRR
jgi:hypothetical protein